MSIIYEYSDIFENFWCRIGLSKRVKRNVAYALYIIPFPASIFLREADLYQQQKPTHRNFFSSIQNAHQHRQDFPKDCQTRTGPF